MFAVRCDWKSMFAAHVRQEVVNSFRVTHSHQHALIAEQNLHGNKHQDLTGAADDFIPNPADQSQHSTVRRSANHTRAQSIRQDKKNNET